MVRVTFEIANTAYTREADRVEVEYNHSGNVHLIHLFKGPEETEKCVATIYNPVNVLEEINPL